MFHPVRFNNIADDKNGVEKFSQRMGTPTYRRITDVRCEIDKFLTHRNVQATYRHALLLSVSEILTNLIKHPVTKPTIVDIALTLQEKTITLDIADNGSPFATFDAKRNTVLKNANVALTLSESGYGLACMLQQHANVSYLAADQNADGFNHFIISDTFDTPAPVSEADYTPNTHKRVYLVDDDPVMLSIHEKMMENIYDVHTFISAHDAIDAIRAQSPDIIISDLSMPEMDGVSLRKAISELRGGNAIPFVFLSGQKFSEHSAYINHIGIDDFLCKPITKERLLAVTARLLARSEQISQAVQKKFDNNLTTLLKPHLPNSAANWRIKTLCFTAEAGGGDFTIYEEAPEHMTFILADVMGHGLQAKFFSYAYAGYLRSLLRIMSDISNTAQFLERVSKSVNDDPFLETVIMTCQAVQLFADGTIKISSAGHPAPLTCQGKNIETIDVAGPLPGLLGESRYHEKILHAKAGARFIFATDGFFEKFSAADAQHTALRKSIISGAAQHHDLDDFTGALWACLLEARTDASHQSDDATLIILEYQGSPT